MQFLLALAHSLLLQTPATPTKPPDEWVLTEKEEGEAFGQSVTQVGDIDGDGVPDLVVGSFSRAGAVITIRMLTDTPKPIGRLFAYSTRTHERLWTRSWKESCVAFGECLAVIPDQDGDGVDDLAVGLTDLSVSGNLTKALNGTGVAIVSSKRGVVLKEWSLDCEEVLKLWWVPSQAGSGLGELLCGVMNKNRVGRIIDLSPSSGKVLWKGADLPYASSFARIDRQAKDPLVTIAVGCPEVPGDAAHKDKVLVVSTYTGKVVEEIESPAAHEGFGAAVCPLGDIDGDGATDLAISATEAREGSERVGAVYVRRSGDKTIHLLLRGSVAGSRFGFMLACTGQSAELSTRRLYISSYAQAKAGIAGSTSVVDIIHGKTIEVAPGNPVWSFEDGKGHASIARLEYSTDYGKNVPSVLRIQSVR